MLVEAELAAINKDDGAVALYETAIQCIRSKEAYHWEALACELAGRFFLSKQSTITAEYYLHRAAQMYQAWGATHKVQLMMVEFDFIEKVKRHSYFDGTKSSSG